MPIKNVPEEIRDVFEKIEKKLKKDHPDWDGEKLYKVTWDIIKKTYKKKDGKWVKKAKYAKSEIEFDLYAIEDYLPIFDRLEFEQWQAAVKKRRDFDGDKDKVVLETSDIKILKQSKYDDIVKAELENKNPDDFIIMEAVLATSKPFVNGNRDSFFPEDMEEAIKEGQMQDFQVGVLDVNHNFFPVGAVVDAYLRDSKVLVGRKMQVVKQIVVIAVFWKWLFLWEAEQIKDWAEANLLKFSMACKQRGGFQCGDCGANSKENYCEHFEKNTYHERIVLKPYYYSISIITPDKMPADENADLLTIASQENNLNQELNEEGGNNMDKVQELEKKILELDKQILELDKAKEKLEDANEALKTSVKEKDTTITTAQEAHNELQGKFEAVEKERDEALKSLDEAKNDLEAAKETIKTYREGEVERIEEEVNSKIDTVEGLSDDAKEYWKNKFKPVLSEEGEVQFDREGFEATLEHMPKVEIEESNPDGDKLVDASQDVKGVGNNRQKDNPKLKSDKVM